MIGAAVRKAVDETTARLAPILEEARAAKEAKASQPAQQFTRTQLNELVEAGKLTQDAADAILENQIVDRATRAATEKATQEVAGREQQRTTTEQLAEFQALVPDAWVPGTSERESVESAYRDLVASGLKGTKEQLEVAALRAAFGAPASIRKARGLGKNGPSESFEDTGGAGGGNRRGAGESTDGPPRGLTARQVQHYERGIQAGRYKGWSDVREELKFASKAART